MKKSLSNSRRFVLCVLFLLFVARVCPADTIAVRADSWMPYNGEPNADKPGYAVEVLRDIFGPTSIDYQTLNWEESLKQVRARKIDAVIGANKTEAKGLIVPDEPIGLPKMALFVLKTNPWEYSTPSSLKSIKLGAIAGYSYWDWIDDYIKANPDKVVILTGDTPLADGIKMLENKEISVLPESIAVFTWSIRSRGKAINDYRIAYSYLSEPIFVAFAATKAGQARAAIFDEGIKRLRASGKLSSILKKYDLFDWTQS